MDHPDSYSDLFNVSGKITIIGFGSLVSEKSARKSFVFDNFRLGKVRGWSRVFNLSSWICIDYGETRYSTGEVCALSFCEMEGASSIVALLDIDLDGLKSFLAREAGYEIVRVSYLDELGYSGIALACAAALDSDMDRIWGDRHKRGCWASGKIFYLNERDPCPLFPAKQLQDGTLEYRDHEIWEPMDKDGKCNRPHHLPVRRFVYPAPGYVRLCYRAHVSKGLGDYFLDHSYLMDCKTTLRTFLMSNPLLMDYIVDPQLYDDRICDQLG